jgi:hypothetical protein
MIAQVRHMTNVGIEMRLRLLQEAQDSDESQVAASVSKYVVLERSLESGCIPQLVEEVLTTGRFRYLGLNKDGLPVIVTNWMWGTFLDVRGGLDTLVHAYYVFIRRVCAQLSRERCTNDQEPELLSISVGGPPPVIFVTALAELRKVLFLNHIASVFVYRMEASSAKAEITRKCMTSSRWNAKRFNANATSQKAKMVATAAELVAVTNASDGLIPDDVLYEMIQPTGDKIQSTRDAWSAFYAAAQQTRGELGQEAVVVKNTFLDVEEGEVKPFLRRNLSFSEFGAYRTSAKPSDDTVNIGEGASTVSCDGSFADSCESSVCSGTENDGTPARRGKGSVGEAATAQRSATRSTEPGDKSFVDSCESWDDQWAGSTVLSRTFPVFPLGSQFQRTKHCDDSFVDSCASSDYEDAIPCEGKPLPFLPKPASRRTEFADAPCFVDSCDESIWSDAENTIPVPRQDLLGPTVRQRQTRCPPPAVWSSKPKLSGKRRKSGWTRQRRSRAIAEEAKIVVAERLSDTYSTILTLPTNTTPVPLNYPGHFSNMCAAYIVPVCVATPYTSNLLNCDACLGH